MSGSYQRDQPYDAHVSPREWQRQQMELQQPAGPQPPAAAAGYPGAGAMAPQPQYGIAPVAQPPLIAAVAPVLPPGAQLYNGGILCPQNLFHNAYRVPGPNGRGYCYY